MFRPPVDRVVFLVSNKSYIKYLYAFHEAPRLSSFVRRVLVLPRVDDKTDFTFGGPPR